MMTWCYREMDDRVDLWAQPSQGLRPHEPRVDGLLLVYRGEPVPMGVFRAWYMADDSDYDELNEALADTMEDLVGWVSSLKRSGTLLGRVACLDREGRQVY